MDYQVRWSPEAVEDVEEIAAYIHKDSPIYAQKVVEELIAASRRLTQFPLRGRNVPELTSQEHPPEPSVDTYITVKGRILIPAKVRRLLGIKEGTRIQVDVDEQTRRVILTPITHEYIQSLRGKYKGKGLLKALAVEKNRAKNAC